MKCDNNKHTTAKGYHVMWLMPVESLFAFSMLALGLKFGFDLAFLSVLPVFGYVIKKIADNETKVSYDIKSWTNDMELAIRNNQEIPPLESYAVIEYKQKKQETPSTFLKVLDYPLNKLG